MIKSFILTATALFSLNAFAVSTLTCTSDEGTTIKATVNGDAGSVPHNFKLRFRDGELKDYPTAIAQFYETEMKFTNGNQSEEVLKSLVVVDPTKKILAVVIDGKTLVDDSGTYEASCSYEY